jgi:hypothetical protein
MTNNENNTGTNQQLEQRLINYFSLYIAEPKYKSTLQKQLHVQASQQSMMGTTRRKNTMFSDIHYHPLFRWVAGLMFIILIIIVLLAIRPARAAIERLLDIGYISGAGFVRVSETYILTGPIYSVRPDQTIVIDQVIAGSKSTKVLMHSTGKEFSPNIAFGNKLTYLQADGQHLQVNSWGWDSSQEGVLVFDPLSMAASMSIILHISPDWSIPIRLIPMDQIPAIQSTTIYPNICQTHLDVELCLRAFVSDSNGYHLWLSALSENPIFYLPILEIHNPLSGEDATLTDASGHHLTQIYTEQLPIPIEAEHIGSVNNPKEVSTTLSFDRSTNDNGSLTLLVPGLTGETPANKMIVCKLGKDLQIGDHFPCEQSISIAGEQIQFHEGEITQQSDGIHLTLLSDPIRASDGFWVTSIWSETLDNVTSSMWGNGFHSDTNQLEIWSVVDSLNTTSRFAIRITAANLTIIEPFELTWKLNP